MGDWRLLYMVSSEKFRSMSPSADDYENRKKKEGNIRRRVFLATEVIKLPYKVNGKVLFLFM